MIDSGDRTVLIEQRTAGHALRELLRHLDHLNGAFGGQRRYRSGSDVDFVAWAKARKSERRRVVAGFERAFRYLKFVVLCGGVFVRENPPVARCLTFVN